MKNVSNSISKTNITTNIINTCLSKKWFNSSNNILWIYDFYQINVKYTLNPYSLMSEKKKKNVIKRFQSFDEIGRFVF